MKLYPGVVALLVVASGCSGGAGVSGDAVGMAPGHRFDPETLRVTAGATVTFVNESPEAHTVTAYEERIPPAADYFSSGGRDGEEAARDDVGAGLIKEDATYEVTFEVAGTYEYFCIPHEDDGMTGTIVVEEG